VIIDKGTMDAICCSQSYKENIAAMEREISRVLVPGGIYIVFSYGKPVLSSVKLFSDCQIFNKREKPMEIVYADF
jgi:ubiquinone/menaquinone biosynthesis C-methylase UbiE